MGAGTDQPGASSAGHHSPSGPGLGIPGIRPDIGRQRGGERGAASRAVRIVAKFWRTARRML